MAADLRICVTKFNLALKWLQTTYDQATAISSKSDVSSRDRLRFMSRFRDMEKYRAQIEDAYSILLCNEQAMKEGQRADFDNSYERYMELHYSTQVVCDTICQSQQSSEQPAPAQGASTIDFQLPKIDLIHFSGVHTEWTNFNSVFKTLIHENQRLNPIQKMFYLLGVLEKEPLALVKHLPITLENYEVAYRLLVERYENKRIIADKHVEAILNLSNLTQVNAKTLNKFLSILKENTCALAALKFDVEAWSFLLLHIILKKIPTDMLTKFESGLCDVSEIPTFAQLLKFLDGQLRILENISGTSPSSKAPTNSVNVVHSELKPHSAICPCCRDSHTIYYCSKFSSMTPKQRREVVSKHKLCLNCLRPHHISKCISTSVCQVCRERHHTKLHTTEPFHLSPSPTSEPDAAVSTSSTVQSLHGAHNGSTMVLGTASVRVRDINGEFLIARALIDNGSQVSIITEDLAQKLKLPRTSSGAVMGLGSAHQSTHGAVSCVIYPKGDSTGHLSVDCIVLRKITGNLPSAQVDSTVVDLCKHLVLADERFTAPGPIDMLLGIDVYNDIFDGRKFSLGEHMPTAHSSILGWVIMGKAPAASAPGNSPVAMACTADLERALTRFWDIEEVPNQRIPDPEDVLCEKHFVETHTRDSTGRFVVRLPFKVDRKPLGDTYVTALKRFHNLERRLLKDPSLRELYIAFMRDYEAAGHMCEVSGLPSSNGYYIPHHGVLRAHSTTTKLRTVFDASSASSTGVSLNQALMSGPKLQQQIEDIILRFRTHRVVFTCDIKQMYRQVRMADEDCAYQTILWRESPTEPVKQFELKTVTYGITSSAFQAIRVIHELAHLNASLSPAASRALLEDSFVDDVCSGASDLPSALDLQKELVAVLSQGGFELRKWSSNSKEFLESQMADHCEQPYRFEEDGNNVYKVLGMEWNAESDSFVYRVALLKHAPTKRGVLSSIARLYDPCGFLAPLTFFAKHVMQTIWASQIGWDDPLPSEIALVWEKFVVELPKLNGVSIPRLILDDRPVDIQLHGFCDASERGYAACVYLRVRGPHRTSVHLLMAKSRVAPLKQKLTIPKLELSGAHLLARLLQHVFGILESKVNISSTVAWCDSSIVLAWLKLSPHRLQTFEGNRVSQIQAIIPTARWHYVPSAQNPADSASRGLLPSELAHHELWWSPPWLAEDCLSWPENSSVIEEDLPGLKPSKPASHLTASGRDISTRSATANGTLLRPVVKLSPLLPRA